MKKIIFWLRFSYWISALGDFLIAIIVLIPEINGEDHYSLTMGMMSSAALSWGVLLIFADRRPVERRWILLPTMLVVLLLAVMMILAGSSGIISMTRCIVRVTAFMAVLALLSFSYLKARQIKEPQ